MSEEADLLAEARTLRRRARADRHAYWFPLVFFGVATAVCAPLYVQRLEPLDLGPDGVVSLYAIRTDPRIGSYWTVVLLAGAMLSAWWYRRQGRRVGIEGRIGPPLVAATLFLMAYVALSVLPGGAPSFLWPLWIREFSALLVIAVGLLALAWQERSPGLAVTATVYTAAAVLANTYDLANLADLLGWEIPVSAAQQPNLLLPAAVLLAGGLVAGLQEWRTR